MTINETHDPNLTSWVESANDPGTDFPIQNLPLCAFVAEHDGHRHVHYATLIGDRVVDVSMLAESGRLGDDALARALQTPDAMGFLDDPGVVSSWRRRLQAFLSARTAGGQADRRLRERAVVPLSDVPLVCPIVSLNYTDFYASIHHATTVGSMFRPDAPLLPNYRHVPIGYHGRASSIVVSGSEVRRPRGQLPPPDDRPEQGPTFGPSRMLDYELEVGAFVGPGNRLGEPIPIRDAEAHVFGLCLVNDWSARDIQKWEYQPLGPFLAKSFATTISPCVVTLEALDPFRCPASARSAGDPRPLEYLRDETNERRGGFDITLEAWLRSAEMERRGLSPVMLSRSNAFREMYWTFAQLLTHHASNGCNLQPGDLLASGTVSGREPGERGCLLELTWQGRGPDGRPLPRRPIDLPTGETRTFLEDGDEVILKGYCRREGFRRIGFGECRGRIVPPVKG